MSTEREKGRKNRGRRKEKRNGKKKEMKTGREMKKSNEGRNVCATPYCCCCCFVSVWIVESAASCVCVFFLSPVTVAAVGGEGVRECSRCMGLFSRLPAEGTVNVLPNGVCAMGVGYDDDDGDDCATTTGDACAPARRGMCGCAAGAGKGEPLDTDAEGALPEGEAETACDDSAARGDAAPWNIRPLAIGDAGPLCCEGIGAEGAAEGGTATCAGVTGFIPRCAFC